MKSEELTKQDLMELNEGFLSQLDKTIAQLQKIRKQLSDNTIDIRIGYRTLEQAAQVIAEANTATVEESENIRKECFMYGKRIPFKVSISYLHR